MIAGFSPELSALHFIDYATEIGAGGIATALRDLVDAQVSSGLTSRVVAKHMDLQSSLRWPTVVQTFPETRTPGMRFASNMGDFIRTEQPNLIHVHGLWTNWSIQATRLARAKQIPRMVSPHGMLDPWALRHSKWKKRIGALLFERQHLNGASCIHALCESELKSIRDFGLKNPVCLVPNGVTSPTEIQRKPDSSRPKVCLFLGRLHPKKGLVELLDAWNEFRKTNAAEDWRLVITGWSEDGHLDLLKSQCRELELEFDETPVEQHANQKWSSLEDPKIYFTGPAYDTHKAELLRRADSFILPSHSEGLPMAVLEAWSFSLPVLITHACNLNDAKDSGGGFFMDPCSQSVGNALKQLSEMSDEDRIEMGRRGRNLVESKYDWSQIADDMTSVYRWQIDGGEAPDCVHFAA